ncbi:hypothetical protein [Rhizobium sophoriradicis]|uniref:Uncharacterized protein n=1 Tax=Rhizobium sophoriradicis TaxID=1535245 RepID=A0A2A5KKT5_9HYPH|nr:hypothetical protein [Rhizobium sophoriradicis]PCK77679.1 hypothetical protein CPT34_28710 [Rhizobium sophoriradicis]
MNARHVLHCAIKLYVVVIAATLQGQPSLAQTPAGVSVSREEAICIAKIAEALLDDPNDPVTIYLDICVSKDKQDALVAGDMRTDLPNLKDPPISPKAPAVRSVPVSKKALQCVRSKAGDPAFPASDPVDLETLCP